MNSSSAPAWSRFAVGAAELLDERADEPLGRPVERVEQVDAAAGAVDGLVHAVEDALDLLVQLGPVGDKQNAGIRLVLAQIHLASQTMVSDLPEPWVCQMMPPSRRVHALLRGLDAEVLVWSAGLLDPGVEDHEVVHDLQQPVLGCQQRERLVERPLDTGEFRIDLSAGGRVDVRDKPPVEPVLLRCIDDGVGEALDVVTSHDELHGRKERADELGLLVADGLADALGHCDARALQLQRHQGDAVDVQDDIRTLGVLAEHRHFLGHGEVVGLRVLPVDQPDCLGTARPRRA